MTSKKVNRKTGESKEITYSYKRIDENKGPFYLFEQNENFFSIFDREMNQPIYYGNNSGYISILKNINSRMYIFPILDGRKFTRILQNLIISSKFKFILPENHYYLFKSPEKYILFDYKLDVPLSHGGKIKIKNYISINIGDNLDDRYIFHYFDSNEKYGFVETDKNKKIKFL